MNKAFVLVGSMSKQKRETNCIAMTLNAIYASTRFAREIVGIFFYLRYEMKKKKKNETKRRDGREKMKQFIRLFVRAEFSFEKFLKRIEACRDEGRILLWIP